MAVQYYEGIGRRKESTARVRVMSGSGKFVVNDKPGEQYFTRAGDVTQIMPASHPGLGGAEGHPHTAAFRIVDPELAYVVPAKVLAMCAIDLLSDQAVLARQIIKQHPPLIAPDGSLRKVYWYRWYPPKNSG